MTAIASHSTLCKLSIVMPCLNEEKTIAGCLQECFRALETLGIAGEVIVADNGSTDCSREIIRAQGARLVEVETQGYGAALLGGFQAAAGEWIIFADADGSYDFSQIGRIVEALDQGFDLVLCSRFRGKIEAGAMPPLHRYLGTPVLTTIHRIFFGTQITDSQSGMRGLRKEILSLLDLKTCGMEFASEMLVKASLLNLKIQEVPIDFRKDKRDRPPHLKTWRDGWRHLRFLLLYSPRWLFIYPGLLLMTFGGAIALYVLPGSRPVIGHIALDVHTLLCGSMGVIVGYQLVLFGVYARQFAAVTGLIPDRGKWVLGLRSVSLEFGIAVGLLALIFGVIPLILALRGWARVDFGAQDYSVTMRYLIPGLTLCILGIQTIFGSFLLSILKLPIHKK